MEKEFIGSEAPITTGGARDMEHDGKTGSPLLELIGDGVPLSRTPVSLWPINEGTGTPVKEFIGDDAPLSRTEYHGWQSHDTPMSNRAHKQSK